MKKNKGSKKEKTTRTTLIMQKNSVNFRHLATNDFIGYAL
jgi:hypothetical protein